MIFFLNKELKENFKYFFLDYILENPIRRGIIGDLNLYIGLPENVEGTIVLFSGNKLIYRVGDSYYELGQIKIFKGCYACNLCLYSLHKVYSHWYCHKCWPGAFVKDSIFNSLCLEVLHDFQSNDIVNIINDRLQELNIYEKYLEDKTKEFWLQWQFGNKYSLKYNSVELKAVQGLCEGCTSSQKDLFLYKQRWFCKECIF